MGWRAAAAAVKLEVGSNMDVSEAVRRRMSVRAFLDRPVAGETVREILELAHGAPSGGNLQPWRVCALAGEPLAEFKALIAATPM